MNGERLVLSRETLYAAVVKAEGMEKERIEDDCLIVIPSLMQQQISKSLPWTLQRHTSVSSAYVDHSPEMHRCRKKERNGLFN